MREIESHSTFRLGLPACLAVHSSHDAALAVHHVDAVLRQDAGAPAVRVVGEPAAPVRRLAELEAVLGRGHAVEDTHARALATVNVRSKEGLAWIRIWLIAVLSMNYPRSETKQISVGQVESPDMQSVQDVLSSAQLPKSKQS